MTLWRTFADGLFRCFIRWIPVVVDVVNLKNDMKSYLYFRFRVFLTARISSIQLSCPGLRPIFGTPIISFKSTLTGANAESALEIPILKKVVLNLISSIISMSLLVHDIFDVPLNQLPKALHLDPFELVQTC